MTENLRPLLAQHAVLERLPEDLLDILAGCARNVRFQAGEMLFREGEPADSFFLLRHGRVALELAVPGAGAVTVQTCEDGDGVGWSWLIPPHRWRYSGRAVTETRALTLDGACLRRKCEESPALGYHLLRRVSRVLARRLEATQLQLLDIYAGKS